jgi:CRISPR-associated protein Csd2
MKKRRKLRMSLSNKIDFAVVFSVKNANPNGDPINGNRPRQTYDGFGEVSDVCLKRKLRNRLLDMGEKIFVQSDDNRRDECKSLEERVTKLFDKVDNIDVKRACSEWYDVRAFGQVFPFGSKNSKSDETSVSIGVRGPVSIHSAFSLEIIDITTLQITKSVNLKTEDKKGSDTMGAKHRVDKGIYVTFGSINCQLAEKTGFSDEDADKLKEALRTMFRNDSAAARPDGSMEVLKLVWWQHSCINGNYPAAKVHRSLNVNPADGSVEVTPLAGLIPEITDGE